MTGRAEDHGPNFLLNRIQRSSTIYVYAFAIVEKSVSCKSNQSLQLVAIFKTCRSCRRNVVPCANRTFRRGTIVDPSSSFVPCEASLLLRIERSAEVRRLALLSFLAKSSLRSFLVGASSLQSFLVGANRTFRGGANRPWRYVVTSLCRYVTSLRCYVVTLRRYVMSLRYVVTPLWRSFLVGANRTLHCYGEASLLVQIERSIEVRSSSLSFERSEKNNENET